MQSAATHTVNPSRRRFLFTGVAGAVVLVSAMDGTVYQVTTQADGAYTLASVPAGLYTPMAAKSAPRKKSSSATPFTRVITAISHKEPARA